MGLLNRGLTGESRDMIVFANDERDAVKDEIMNGEILRYTVMKLVNTTPTISVIIKLEEKKEEAPEKNTGKNDEKEPETTDDVQSSDSGDSA